jgi:hypothetical protein
MAGATRAVLRDDLVRIRSDNPSRDPKNNRIVKPKPQSDLGLFYVLKNFCKTTGQGRDNITEPCPIFCPCLSLPCPSFTVYTLFCPVLSRTLSHLRRPEKPRHHVAFLALWDKWDKWDNNFVKLSNRGHFMVYRGYIGGI